MRVVVGLEPNADPDAVHDAVLKAGAASAAAPAGGPANVLVAELPDLADPVSTMSALRKLSGVAYAEPVVIREAFSSE